ncbi:MAG: hypothetical protein AMXMBFR57_19760 [Acidimicrobiia bacterium]
MSLLHRRLLVLAGVVIAGIHLIALPPSLEDLDSVNFAMGVERFDVAQHRPHPPGYPVFIAAGKAATRGVAAVAPQWSRERRAAAGLAIWGALAAGCGVWVFAAFWRAVGLPPVQATLASLLALVSPLFWLTASRPLSDVPGLVGAVAVQAALVLGLRRWREQQGDAVPRLWWLAAFAAGVLIGLRSQTMWLTGPLLCWCAGELAGRRQWRPTIGLFATAAAGVLVWLVPMVVMTGGVDAYLAALGSQGAEDFTGVRMLATQPSLALLREALEATLHTPWLHSALGTTVITLAAIGALRLALRGQRMLALVLLAFWPYFVFHITFQETETIRYALPVVVPLAGFVIAGLFLLPRRAAIASAAVILAVTAGVAQPPLLAYRATPAPIFRAFEVIATAGDRLTHVPDVVAIHRRIRSESAHARTWMEGHWSLTVLPRDGAGALSATISYWREGATGPVWLIANPIRHDLALIDPRVRQRIGAYRWPPATRSLVAFARPTDVDLWLLTRPRWMLGSGWAVTPEIGGVTAAAGLGPHREPAIAYLRREGAALRIVIGGRHLGSDADAAVRLSATLDGREIAQWIVAPDARQFSQWIDLPLGVAAGDDAYAELRVRASSVDGGPIPPVGLEYFDAASFDDVIWGYGDGWHEPEQNPELGTFWRWMQRDATVRVSAPAGGLEIRVAGEAPLRTLGGAPVLRVLVNGVERAQRTLGGTFDEVITIDAATRSGGDDQITLRVDRDFSPSEIEDSPDRRRLSLRIGTVEIRASGAAGPPRYTQQ